MSQTPRPMKRTDGMTGTARARRPSATPYPYPYPFLETPSKRASQSAIAPRQTASKVKEGRRGFSVLDKSDEEEDDEEVEPSREMKLNVGIKQEKEKNELVGKKGKSLVRHSPDPKYSFRTSRGASKAPPSIRALTTKSANISRVTRSTTAQPTSQTNHENLSSPVPSTFMKPPNAPRKVKKEFKIPAPPSKARPTKKTPRPKSQARDVDTLKAFISRASAVEMSEVIGNSFFHPDGTTRDIYVQGSEMVVKIRVEVPIYMDGSPSNVSEDVIAHITSSLEHLMVPFLHHLTFRHTAPITEKECFIRDVPIVYHMVHKPHGEGNTFERTRLGDECLMWEDMLVITPYLIIDEE